MNTIISLIGPDPNLNLAESQKEHEKRLLKSIGRKYLWPCTVEIESTMMDKRNRKLKVEFDGDANGGNIRNNAIGALRKRMRKPWLWYGVGFLVHKPFEQIEGIFEPRNQMEMIGFE